MKRREILLAGAALATGGGVAGVLASGKKPKPKQKVQTPADSLASPNISRNIRQLQMATSWPKDFPGLGIMPVRFAQAMNQMSDGLIEVKVAAAGEIVGALECFNATASGGVDMYHAAEYYWQGKSKAFSFFTAVPMGMTAAEIMAWTEFGGGQELWDELSAGYNVKAFHAGNTGHQTGGWFKKKMNTVEDFKGLNMRMPGLGGEVLKRLGASAVPLPGGEIFQALQSGNIDATEWVGPWNDYAFGFYREAPYYYAPGFHEPGAALALGINLDVWNSFTSTEQAIVKFACKAANDSSIAEYTHENGRALKILKDQHKIEPQYFSQDIIRAIAKASEDVVGELSAADSQTRRIYESYLQARESYRGWTELGDGQYIRARREGLDG
ncbi:MAG: TRAP transporter substrate-binding protein [Hellea sp.]|nr:TRAP transporter substrate-binding protein [Hellea sp.]